MRKTSACKDARVTTLPRQSSARTEPSLDSFPPSATFSSWRQLPLPTRCSPRRPILAMVSDFTSSRLPPVWWLSRGANSPDERCSLSRPPRQGLQRDEPRSPRTDHQRHRGARRSHVQPCLPQSRRGGLRQGQGFREREFELLYPAHHGAYGCRVEHTSHYPHLGRRRRRVALDSAAPIPAL